MASQKTQTWLLILVASLGYFVDIYDLILFQVVKEASLIDLGITDEVLRKSHKISLFNWQMSGMLVGGLVWGVLGDKLGRIKTLFGSILLYSLANIANAYVWDVPSYAAVRFMAGLGLAGELGAGITLISEVMHKDKRGYGTMIMVTFGALGAVFAYLVAESFSSWKSAYWVGGLMGLALLALRIGTMESDMFKAVKHEKNRGNFFLLFQSKARLLKYLACIGMGLPVWFVVGVLIALIDSHFSKALHFPPSIQVGKAIMFVYIGLSVGDLLAGLLSQWFKSRLKVVLAYLIFSAIMSAIYLSGSFVQHQNWIYGMSLLLGISTGYWALFVTVSAEQFGTNIRSTVANTVPNFVRGAVVPITLLFKNLAESPQLGTRGSASIVGIICIGIAIISTLYLKESFGKDLNFSEK
jgi:MFS family permease